jgi:hypothetical protein
MYMDIHLHDFKSLYVHCTYIYIVHTCTLYINVHKCLYMFGHCTDTSVHVHTHTSFPIKPDQPCDAGSESQLRAGAAPSESELPSWHQSFQLTDHPGAACHVQTAKATGSPHTTCTCMYNVHSCSVICTYMSKACIYKVYTMYM